MSTTYYLRNVTQDNYAGVQVITNGSAAQGYTYSVNDPTQIYTVTKDAATGQYSITMGSYRAINDPNVPLGSNATVVLSDQTKYSGIQWTLDSAASASSPNAFLIYQTDATTSQSYYWTLDSSQSPTTIKLTGKLGGTLAATQYWVLEVAKF